MISTLTQVRKLLFAKYIIHKSWFERNVLNKNQSCLKFKIPLPMTWHSFYIKWYQMTLVPFLVHSGSLKQDTPQRSGSSRPIKSVHNLHLIWYIFLFYKLILTSYVSVMEPYNALSNQYLQFMGFPASNPVPQPLPSRYNDYIAVNLRTGSYRYWQHSIYSLTLPVANLGGREMWAPSQYIFLIIC